MLLRKWALYNCLKTEILRSKMKCRGPRPNWERTKCATNPNVSLMAWPTVQHKKAKNNQTAATTSGSRQNLYIAIDCPLWAHKLNERARERKDIFKVFPSVSKYEICHQFIGLYLFVFFRISKTLVRHQKNMPEMFLIFITTCHNPSSNYINKL